MTRSEFLRAIDDQFGAAYGRSVVRDVVLGALGDRTAEEALAQGVAPKEVWLAVCLVMDVPRERWHGAGRPEARRA